MAVLAISYVAVLDLMVGWHGSFSSKGVQMAAQIVRIHVRCRSRVLMVAHARRQDARYARVVVRFTLLGQTVSYTHLTLPTTLVV